MTVNGLVLKCCALEGKKLDILKSNGIVCFEMAHEGEPVHSETPCNSGYHYSSIIGFGQAVFIEDVDEKRKALSIMFSHQSGREVIFTDEQAQSVCVFKVVSNDFTGKKKPRPDTTDKQADKMMFERYTGSE